MANNKNKTVANKLSVYSFLNAIDDPKKKKEAKIINKVMSTLTGEKPILWGTSIIGFGQYHYKYDSGREGDFMKEGFSPRKTSLTIYIMSGFSRFKRLLEKLGKHKIGKSCLYIKKLDDIDIEVLEKLISESFNYMTKKYG